MKHALPLVALSLSMLAAGCQTARRTFQVDSRAPVPTQGLELTGQPAPSAPDPKDVDDLQPVDLEPMDEAAGESRWSRLLGGRDAPKPLPLPRTDLPTGDVFEEPSPTHRVPDVF